PMKQTLNPARPTRRALSAS
ncbi:hypothetical protein EE612_024016, partial [Oryza sativa]